MEDYKTYREEQIKRWKEELAQLKTTMSNLEKKIKNLTKWVNDLEREKLDEEKESPSPETTQLTESNAKRNITSIVIEIFQELPTTRFTRGDVYKEAIHKYPALKNKTNGRQQVSTRIDNLVSRGIIKEVTPRTYPQEFIYANKDK